MIKRIEQFESNAHKYYYPEACFVPASQTITYKQDEVIILVSFNVYATESSFINGGTPVGHLNERYGINISDYEKFSGNINDQSYKLTTPDPSTP